MFVKIYTKTMDIITFSQISVIYNFDEETNILKKKMKKEKCKGCDFYPGNMLKKEFCMNKFSVILNTFKHIK